MVSVPKKKPTRTYRRARHHKLFIEKLNLAPSMTKCPSCGGLIKKHSPCVYCGKFKGVDVLGLAKRELRSSRRLEKFKKQVRVASR